MHLAEALKVVPTTHLSTVGLAVKGMQGECKRIQTAILCISLFSRVFVVRPSKANPTKGK